MAEDSSTYFTRRAEAELEQAKRAASPHVAQVHRQLAQAYLERLTPDARANLEERK